MKELERRPLSVGGEAPDLSLAFERHHALVVGVDQYTDARIANLRNAVSDARAIADVLRRDHAFDVTLLCDADATRERLLRELADALPRRTGGYDRLFVYLACHGLTVERDRGPQGHLLLHDARYEVPGSFVAMSELDELLGKLPCGHALVVLDCCFAGSFRWSTRDVIVRDRPLYREHFDYYVRSKSWHAIASAAYDETAADVYRDLRGRVGDHSPFAQALLEGLRGDADVNGDGFVTSCELLAHVDGKLRTRGLNPQTPEMFALRNHRRGYFLFQHPDPLKRRPLGVAPEFQPDRNPYRGLESFSEKEQDKFFGRQRATSKLSEAACRRRLTVVLAPSGLGKSSLVKAGLVPALRREGWHICEVMRLGEHPLHRLEDALASACSSRASPRPPGALAPTLLVIDQLEEVFTLCRDKAEREAFLERLGSLLALDHEPKIVATLRSDFEPLFADGPLKAWWPEGRFLVEAMSREELEEAIKRPVELHALYFDQPRLVDELIDEVQQRPGSLPMLSFALEQFYLQAVSRHPDERVLRRNDYDAIGGLTGAIQAAARREYERLVGHDQKYADTIRHLMLRMVSTEGGAPTRRRVAESELVYADEGQNERVWRALEAFTKARLLVRGADESMGPYVEPAHDILVRGWDQMLAWREEAAGDLIMQREARNAALRWQTEGQLCQRAAGAGAWRRWRLERSRDSNLWGDAPLLHLLVKRRSEVSGLLNRLEDGFVTRSSERVRRSRALTRSAVAATMAALTGFAFYAQRAAQGEAHQRGVAEDRQREAEDQQRKAEDRRQQAEEATTRAQAAEANANASAKAANQSADDAKAALARETKAREEEAKAKKNAEHNQAISEGSRASTLSRQSTGLPSALALALKTASDHFDEVPQLDELWGALFETVYRSTPSQPLDGGGGALRTAWFVTPTAAVATVGDDGTVRLWDAQARPLSWRPLGRSAGAAAPAVSATASADGAIIATADAGGELALWRAQVPETPWKRARCKGGQKVGSLEVSRDGRFVASVSSTSNICLWDSTRQQPWVLAEHGSANALSFSPDGKFFSSAGADGRALLWRAADGAGLKVVGHMLGHQGAVLSVSFAEGAPRIVTAGSDGTARVWSYDALGAANSFATPAPLTPVRTLRGHAGPVTQAFFSRDASAVLTASLDGTARLWDIQREESSPRSFSGHRGAVTSARFSPDESLVVTAGADGTARVWDAKSRRPVRALEGHRDGVVTALFSRDGHAVLTVSKDGTARVWDLRTEGAAKVRLDHPSAVTKLAFSGDGRRLAVGTSSGDLRLWDAKSRAPLAAPPPDAPKGSAVNGLAFTPDGSRLVVAWADGTIRLWHPEHHEMWALGRLRASLRNIAFVDDKHVIIFSEDESNLWDLSVTPPSGAPLTGRWAHARWAASAPSAAPQPMPGQRSVLVIDDGDEATLWPYPDGPRLGALRHRGPLRQITLSAGRRFAAAFSGDLSNGDGLLRVWDTRANREALPQVGSALPPVFAADESQMLTLGKDGAALLWALPAGGAAPVKRRDPPLKQEGAIVDASFSPDSRRFATVDKTGTLVLWKKDGQRLAELSTGPGATQHFVAFAPAGERLAVASGAHALLLSTDHAELFEMACELAEEEARRAYCRPRAPSPGRPPRARDGATSAGDGVASRSPAPGVRPARLTRSRVAPRTKLPPMKKLCPYLLALASSSLAAATFAAPPAALPAAHPSGEDRGGPGSVEPEARGDARSVYDEGVREFDSRHYLSALDRFNEALSIHERFGGLFEDQARGAHDRIIRCLSAIVRYELVVAPPDARVIVDGERLDGGARPAGPARFRVNVSSAPPGEPRRGSVTYELQLDPTYYNIEVSRAGYEPSTKAEVVSAQGAPAEPGVPSTRRVYVDLKAKPIELSTPKMPPGTEVEIRKGSAKGPLVSKGDQATVHNLAPGSYFATFQNADAVESKQTIELKADDWPRKEFAATLSGKPLTSRWWLQLLVGAGATAAVGTGVYFAFIKKKPEDFDGGSTGWVVKF
jgi:WD40 repeat protein